MMTLSVSSGTWSDMLTAAAVELSGEKLPIDEWVEINGAVIERAMQAALRELNIQVVVDRRDHSSRENRGR